MVIHIHDIGLSKSRGGDSIRRHLSILIVLALAMGSAVAKTPPPKPLVPYPGDVRAVESEPNGTCALADPLANGEPMAAALSPAGDADWFAIVATPGLELLIETRPGPGQSGGDTEMTLYAGDCVTQLAYDDDGGEGLYSRLFQVFPEAGTYYVVINEYGDNDVIEAYVLDAVGSLNPGNDDCGNPLDLQAYGHAEFEVDLCQYGGDYSPAAPECTDDYPAAGPDAIYAIDLAAGETFAVCATPTYGFIDLAIWLVSDCGDPENTCVAGEDDGNPECLSYVAPAAGRYYLIVDTYSGCGRVTVTIDAPTAAETRDWGSLKRLYR